MLDENDDLHNAENDVRTFYEDVIQNKTVIIDEHHGPVVGTVIGRANLSINAKPRTQLVINLTKDTFTSAEGDELAYDVGDTVSVVDSLNDIDLKLRIYNIEKSVREGIGEEIVITLGYPNYKYQDTLQQMYSNIKTLGVVGTLNNDWTAEGTDRKLLDARRISKASQQTVNAQNDNISQTIAADTQDWWWTYDNEEERNDDHQYGQEFLWGNNYMGFMGVSGDNNIGQQHKISAVLKGNIVPVHDPNNDKTMPIDIPMWTCPHFIIDIKCCDGIFSDVANAEWKYNRWTCEEVNYGTNTYNSDYCRLGLGAEDGVAGFYFLIRKARESPSQFDIYMIYIFSDGTNNLTPSTPITSIEQIDSAILFKNYGTFLKTIKSNRKYRLEIITESDPKFIATATPNVQFNIYEYTEMIKSGDTTNLDYQLKKYPTMGIVQNQSIPDELVKAFYGEFRTTCHGKDSGIDSDQSIIYFYNFKTEWRVLELQG